VRLFASEHRERFLSFAEISRIGEALSKLEAEGGNRTAIAAIRLLLFTGCRRGEIMGLRWKWVDFERRFIRFPDSKTGVKTIPLGDPAIDLLCIVPAIAGCEFVGDGGGEWILTQSFVTAVHGSTHREPKSSQV
jgi:integrase